METIEAKSGFPIMIANDHAADAPETAWHQLGARQNELLETAGQHGAVLLRDFGFSSTDAFDAFVSGFKQSPFTYESSLSNAVRINLTERVFTANEAPPSVEIFLHHELAQTPVSPRWLYFYCQSAAETGGATPVCRSDWLYETFASYAPDWARQLETLGLQYTTFMPSELDAESGQGRSWKSTLGVTRQEAAEEKLARLGYTFQWKEGGVEATSPALPAVITLGDGAKTLFNQLIAVHRGWKNGSRALRFGDGSELPVEMLELVSELAVRHTVDINWESGDVAIIDNLRVMHGRRPYGGKRERKVLVAMAS